MIKKITLTLMILLTAKTVIGGTIEDIQIFKDGMDKFNNSNFSDARPLLEHSFNSKRLPNNPRVYSAIALSIIYKSTNDYSSAVSVLEKANKDLVPSQEAKKDLNLTLSRLYINKNVRRYSKGYLLAKELKDSFPGEDSIVSNYSLSCMYYAGVLRAENKPETLVQNIFNESIDSANTIISKTHDKNFKAQAFDTIGMIKYLLEDYDDAIKYFHSAIDTSDKPVFHRNLGWALFGGKARKLKGEQKYIVLKEALNEFNTAIDAGDDDKTTKKQIPELKNQVESLATKYEKVNN